jgi:hypothetical protein
MMADGGMMAKGGETFNYKKFDINSVGNLEAKIDGEKYEIIYRDDKTQLYDLFKNGKKIKSSKSVADLMKFEFGGTMADGGMTAGRGRLLSALNRDRAYMSSQEWEKNYKRKGSPKKPKYNTSYAVGGQAKVKQYPDLSNTKPTVIN